MSNLTHRIASHGRDPDGSYWCECTCGQGFVAPTDGDPYHAINVARREFKDHVAWKRSPRPAFDHRALLVSLG